MAKNKSFLTTLCCLPVRFYQYCVSPCLKPNCRFYPSCSQYSLEAIQSFGPVKGIFKSLYRIFRCHPWSLGGYDPVDSNQEKR